MQDKSVNTRRVLEMLWTITSMSLIIVNTIYMPSLATMALFLLPIPITMCYWRNGYKFTLFSTATSAVLISIIYNPLIVALYTFIYVLVGMGLGYCIRKGKSDSGCILITSILMGVATIVEFIVHSLFISKIGLISSLHLIVESIKEPLRMAKDTYISMNASSELIDAISEIIKVITVEELIIITPVVILASSLIQAYFNYFITSKILLKSKIKVNKITSLSRIYIPNLIAAFIIITVCLGIILDSRDIIVGKYIYGTSQYILKFLFGLNGIAFFAHVLRNNLKVSKTLSAVILFIVFIMPIFSDIYLVSGTMDIILNLRGLDPNPIRKAKMRE